MTFVQTGQVDVRKTIIDSALKGFAERMYKMKQAVTISSTGAWKNEFFREDPDTLTANTSRTIKGIPRGAAFPQASTSWEKVSTSISKYGLEESIAWEDIISGEVAVRDRTLFRIAEGVTYAVDREIYTGLTTDASIQSFTIAATKRWNLTGADIFDDLEYAEQKIAEKHYSTSDLMVFVNPRDKRSVMAYLVSKGAQIPSITAQKLNNGVVGTLGNKTFVVSDVVSASHALVVVPKVCGTWKSLVPLTTDVKEEPLKDVRIRAAEYGVLQVTDPNAIVYITGTEA